MLIIFIQGRPAPQGSKTVGVAKSGRIYLRESAKGLKDWKNICILECQSWRLAQKGFRCIDFPVHIDFTFYLKIPKSKAQKTFALSPHAVKPDLSKLIRAVEDALVSAQVLKDDALVCAITAKKVYGVESGVKIEVKAYDSKENIINSEVLE